MGIINCHHYEYVHCTHIKPVYVASMQLYMSFSYKDKNKSNREQVREILSWVQKRDVSSYQAFRQALIDTNQGHVVDRFLPEITDTQPDPEGPPVKKLKSNASTSKFASKIAEIPFVFIRIIIFKQKPVL